jgi:hypothetical protein
MAESLGTTFYIHVGLGIEMTARSKICVCSTPKLYVRSCTQDQVVTANVSVTVIVHRWDISILTDVPHIFCTLAMQIILASLSLFLKSFDISRE